VFDVTLHLSLYPCLLLNHPILSADIPVQPRQRSPTPQMNPSSGLFPYPNVNPFTLPGLAAAAAAANYPAGLAGLAGAAASQHLQNYLFPGSLYGAPPIPKPGGPFNPFDQVPPNLYPYFSGVPPATNWMYSASQFTNVLPPNHPVLQVGVKSLSAWNHLFRIQSPRLVQAHNS